MASDDFHDEDDLAIYESFKKSLAETTDSAFFDEDEIALIFDIAGDHDDDYVRIEALMYAARFFPGSTDMADRKAIFLWSINPSSCEAYLNDHPELKTFIARALRLRMLLPAGNDLHGMLVELVDSAENLTDEEVIQLVDAGAEIGELMWMVENEALLRTKTEYTETLLYELYALCYEHGEILQSAKIMEELTELEPFNGEFWRLLARSYAELEENEKFESALEYALAINPEDYEAIKLKILNLDQSPSEESHRKIVELAENRLGRVSDNVDVFQAILLSYINLGMHAEAIELCEMGKLYYSNEDWFITSVLSLQPENASSILYYFEHFKDDSRWIELARIWEDNDISYSFKVMLFRLIHNLPFGMESWIELARIHHKALNLTWEPDAVNIEEYHRNITDKASPMSNLIEIYALDLAGKYDAVIALGQHWLENHGASPMEGEDESITLERRLILNEMALANRLLSSK